MNYEVKSRSYLDSSFPLYRLRTEIFPGRLANDRCRFFSVKRLFDARSVCLAGNAAPAAVWCVVLLFSSAAAAQNPADNWARCEGSDPDASIAACTALVESGKEDNENQAVAFNSRGIAFAMKGKQDQAITDFNRAIQLEPDYAGAFSNRANAYAAKGEFDQAMADYDRAIQLKPDDSDAYNYRGVAYAVMGHFDKAIADFDRAIQLKPENTGALNNRGSAYDSVGEYERAIAD
jgi:Flp pilus assembly protein TadD